MFLTASQLTILVVTVSLTIEKSRGQDITTCTYDPDSCGCQTDKGLLSLKRFANKEIASSQSSGGAVFYWNPCKDFTRSSVTAACIQNFPASGLSNDAGVHKNTKSSVEDGHAVFSLDGAIGLLHSKIICKCGSGDKFEYLSENPTSYYNLQLTSKACCVGGDSGGRSGSSSALSIGSIILIALLSVILVYIIGGVIIQAGVRKAQGRERFPNVAVWSAVPGLIKDGVRFTFSRGKRTGYDEV